MQSSDRRALYRWNPPADERTAMPESTAESHPRTIRRINTLLHHLNPPHDTTSDTSGFTMSSHPSSSSSSLCVRDQRQSENGHHQSNTQYSSPYTDDSVAAVGDVYDPHCGSPLVLHTASRSGVLEDNLRPEMSFLHRSRLVHLCRGETPYRSATSSSSSRQIVEYTGSTWSFVERIARRYLMQLTSREGPMKNWYSSG